MQLFTLKTKIPNSYIYAITVLIGFSQQRKEALRCVAGFRYFPRFLLGFQEGINNRYNDPILLLKIIV